MAQCCSFAIPEEMACNLGLVGPSVFCPSVSGVCGFSRTLMNHVHGHAASGFVASSEAARQESAIVFS